MFLSLRTCSNLWKYILIASPRTNVINDCRATEAITFCLAGGNAVVSRCSAPLALILIGASGGELRATAQLIICYILFCHIVQHFLLIQAIPVWSRRTLLASPLGYLPATSRGYKKAILFLEEVFHEDDERFERYSATGQGLDLIDLFPSQISALLV